MKDTMIKIAGIEAAFEALGTVRLELELLIKDLPW